MRPRLPRTLFLFAGAPALLFSTACVFAYTGGDARPDEHRHRHHESAREAVAHPTAHARIEGRSGSQLTGTATFVEVAGGVEVRIELAGAPPGWHAVHVHQKGDCSAPDGTSAGGHFNPAEMDHGSPLAANHHAGDLGNLWVDADGVGHHVILMRDLTVTDGPRSVLGRAIIVHAGVDDMTTQPTGNAGGRIGCGVIQ